MSPSAEKVQCPYCLGHPRVKAGERTMYAHDWGRRGYRKRCPGSWKTKEQAKVDKDAGIREAWPESGQPDVQPEDIF